MLRPRLLCEEIVMNSEIVYLLLTAVLTGVLWIPVVIGT
jgi:hypothetical protein